MAGGVRGEEKGERGKGRETTALPTIPDLSPQERDPRTVNFLLSPFK
jgi:hypothetical protein